MMSKQGKTIANLCKLDNWAPCWYRDEDPFALQELAHPARRNAGQKVHGRCELTENVNEHDSATRRLRQRALLFGLPGWKALVCFGQCSLKEESINVALHNEHMETEMTYMTFSHVEKGGGCEVTIAILLWPILTAILTICAVNLVLDARGWSRRLLLLLFWIPCMSILLSVGPDAERGIATWIYSVMNPNSSVGWWLTFPSWAPYLCFPAGILTVYLNLTKRFSRKSVFAEPDQADEKLQNCTPKTHFFHRLLNSKYMLAGNMLLALVIGTIVGTVAMVRFVDTDLSERQLNEACSSAKVNLAALEKLRTKDIESAIQLLERDLYGNDAVHILSKRREELPRVRPDIDELYKLLKGYYSRFGFAGEKACFEGNEDFLKTNLELDGKKRE